MLRLAVFAHYDRDNIIDDYVVNYLTELKKVVTDIVFVSVSNPENLSILSNLVTKSLIRENVGYDFMSWQLGLKIVEDINKYEQVIFCNDSCYGPVYPLCEVFNEMNNKKLDVWGITDSNQLSYHIQSYFLVFNRNVVMSDIFNQFMNSISIEESKSKIVEKYEVGLTTKLLTSGFSLGAYCSYSEIIPKVSRKRIYLNKIFRVLNLLMQRFNEGKGLKNKIFSLYRLAWEYRNKIIEFSVKNNSNTKFIAWKELLEMGDPFVKIMLLRDNPSNIENIELCIKYLEENTDYNTRLIQDHLNRVKVNV